MTTITATIPTPLGVLTAFAGDRGLRAVLFEGADPARNGVRGPCRPAPDHPMLRSLAQQIDEYFSGCRTMFDLALDPVGTEFQLAAWRALCAIPYGETRTYADQARAVGRPTAVRAVGAANGRNPLTIVVPCHRVIGSDGSLTGYAGGVARKRALLELERGRGSGE